MKKLPSFSESLIELNGYPSKTVELSLQDRNDIKNALDILCGCYVDGLKSSFAKDLLRRYGPGTKAGTRARTLFNRL